MHTHLHLHARNNSYAYAHARRSNWRTLEDWNAVHEVHHTTMLLCPSEGVVIGSRNAEGKISAFNVVRVY